VAGPADDATDSDQHAGPGGLFEIPLVVLDEVVKAVPKLVDRTRSQVELARRLATHVPCVGGLFAGRGDVPLPEHEAAQPIDVLQVVAVQDDEATDATVTPIRPEPPAADAPAESDLPVPDYDSLAASQVVPRLASLSADELDAVGSYERAHRNRQTILNKVAQLQAR
jgi:hypothetical protein